MTEPLRPLETWVSIKAISQGVSPPRGYSVVISVPKRVVPLATSRSRIKRLIREALRSGAMHPAENVTWNVIVRKAFPKTAKMADVKAQLEKIVKKLA